MLIRMHLKCIIQAFLYKYSSYLSQKIPTSWQCLHTMLNPTSRAHALWVILHLKTLVPFRVLEDVYPTRILVEFSNNTLCYHSTSSSTKKLQVFSCSVGLVFNFFFFFLLTVLFLQNIFGEGTKGFAPIPSIWIKYLCYALLKHFHLVTYGMWSPDLNTQARLNQLPFELY